MNIWIVYESEKKEIISLNLSPVEYEAAIAELLNRLGI